MTVFIWIWENWEAKLYALDPYYNEWRNRKPVEFETYMANNFWTNFDRVVVNPKTYQASESFLA